MGKNLWLAMFYECYYQAYLTETGFGKITDTLDINEQVRAIFFEKFPPAEIDEEYEHASREYANYLAHL